MNDVLKQRLVGALILVALGVVFWPIIFVEPEPRPAGLDPRMPPRPGVETDSLPSPDRVGLRGSPPLEARSEEPEEPELSQLPPTDPPLDPEPLPEPTEAPTEAPGEESGDGAGKGPDDSDSAQAPDPGRTREEAPEQPRLDEQGVPVAWMLQVISVSRKDSAEQTRAELEAMGLKAYIKPARVNGKTLYRVYVGPKFERARLDAIKSRVDERFGVKSMVRRYLP